MARVEAELQRGNYRVGGLYIQLIKQRIDIGLRLAELGAGHEELLRYLVGLLRRAPPPEEAP